jgi:hypothetical protein
MLDAEKLTGAGFLSGELDKLIGRTLLGVVPFRSALFI